MGALDYKTRRHRRNRLAAELAATYHPRRHFRLGRDVGWHWQFDNPNDLYRRRNRLTYTRDFSNAAWSKANILSVTSDADGVGDLVVPNTTNISHSLTQNNVMPSGVSAVERVRAKAGGYNFLCIDLDGGSTRVWFNLGTGAVGTNASALTATISAAADAPGYYDCTVSKTTTAGLATQLFITSADGGSTAFAGDGTSGVYIARAQLETYTTTPTEYQDVPTTWAQAYLDAVGAERIYAWTDTAGTTPVTAVGEGIGLLLGREYGGATGPSLLANGATGLTGTATAASYSTSTFAGSVSRAGDASNQSWVTWTGLTTSAVHRIRITNTGATSLDVRNGGVAGTIVASIAAGASTWVHPATTGGSTSITITATSNSTTATFTLGQFAVLPGTHLTQATGTAKPTLSARVNLLLSTTTMSTQNVTTVATSYKLSFTGTGTVTLSGTSTAGPLVGTGANDRVSLTFTPTAGTLTLTVSGSVTLADLRTADDAAKNIPAYQRVGATAADHDTDGFPHYAEGDGTDNCWASVATVDGSATDKLTVVAAVTKNSDEAVGYIMQFGGSTAVDGSFSLLAPTNNGLARYGAKTRGTTLSTFVGNSPAYAYPAPRTDVFTVALDNAGATSLEQVRLWLNGAAPSPGVINDGVAATSPGNFAPLTLTVGQSGSGTSRFNGRFYGSTGRFGSMSDSERNNLTRWWQKRIGTA